MECHRCEHEADVKAGKFRGVPFDQTPCGHCELRDQSGYVLEYDEERGADLDDDAVADFSLWFGSNSDEFRISKERRIGVGFAFKAWSEMMDRCSDMGASAFEDSKNFSFRPFF